ncbi:MAG: hypothetical protein AB7S61_01645 [Methanoregulaceae archaeon]
MPPGAGEGSAIVTGPRSDSVCRLQISALIGRVSWLISLAASKGPGDEAEPVLTILWPDEN